MRVKTLPLAGDAEVWNPADPEPFRRLAGDQFVTIDGNTALVRDASGHVMRVYPGWLAVLLDGGGPVVLVSEPRFGRPRAVWGPE